MAGVGDYTFIAMEYMYAIDAICNHTNNIIITHTCMPTVLGLVMCPLVHVYMITRGTSIYDFSLHNVQLMAQFHH